MLIPNLQANSNKVGNKTPFYMGGTWIDVYFMGVLLSYLTVIIYVIIYKNTQVYNILLTKWTAIGPHCFIITKVGKPRDPTSTLRPQHLMRYKKNIYEDYWYLTKKEASFWQVFIRALKDPGFRAVCMYRISHWLWEHRLCLLSALIRVFILPFCHCTISSTARIGPGFVIAHVGDIVIGGGVEMGAYCSIRQGVTLGGNMGKSRAGRTQPKLGDSVVIGAGAKILGPVNLGDRCIIGANAVVLQDVPEEGVAVGVPAKIVRIKECSIPLEDQGGSLARTIGNLNLKIEELQSEVQDLQKQLTLCNLSATRSGNQTKS